MAMISPSSFTTFGELLKHLRLRARLTQRELALRVGYNHAHLSRLEHNQRIPDAATIKALFVPALDLDDELEWAARLLELAAGGRGEVAPVLVRPTSKLPPPKLPPSFTKLLGREEALRATKEILSRPDVRMLTLVGPPGIGKTRLAVQTASELADQFADGVVFVDLSAVREAGLVIPAVAHVLEVRESAGEFLSASLAASLRLKSLLLVLDNFEQVMEAAPAIQEWLGAASRLKVLVTSREPLHISGEHEFSVPSLPAEAQLELFVQRAQAVQPGFTLTPESRPTIAQLCRRLDGLPLAIELAAARVKQFSAEAMLERLDRRLHWLTGGLREGPAWRRTLRGAIDWSYELLEPEEQSAWIRTSIFSGGFTLEAAEPVTGQPLAVILAAADKSLIVPALAAASGQPRFTLLETLREYALERLEDKPDEYTAAARAHALYFLAWAEAAAPELAGAQPADPLRQLEVEHDNLRAALAWAMQNQPDLGVRLTLSLGRFWSLHSYF